MHMADNRTLQLDALVRSIGVNRSSPHAVFLGAGASISSGVPSDWRCIWEWKRDIFLTNNPALRDQFSELSLPSVQERIQRWLESNGHPNLDDPSEYPYYIERCYPIPEDRRLFFQRTIATARPHTGYQHLCLLAEAGIVKSVWTTNFDGLTGKAGTAFAITPVEIGIDCQGRLPRLPRAGELLCVSLHGDYRYGHLMNTEAELQSQEKVLKDNLIQELSQSHLIMCGYSGRDQSIMSALSDAYTRPGTGNLFWCGHGEPDPPKLVASLIQTARTNGRAAYYIQAQGFDDLMTRLAFHCLDGDRLTKARSIAEEAGQQTLLRRSTFSADRLPVTSIIKSNSFPIECPNEVFEFELDGLPDTGVWRWLREKAEGHPVVVVPLRGKILGFGTIDGIKDAFRNHLRGSIERTPIDERDLRYEDGAVTHLLLTALVRSLAEVTGLKIAGRRVLWDDQQFQRENAAGTRCHVFQSVVLTLRKVGASQHLLISPTLLVQSESGEMLSFEAEKQVKQRLLGYQHNNKFNQAVNFWRNALFSSGTTTVEFPCGVASSFRYHVQKAPIFAGIGDPRQRRGAGVAPKIERIVRQSGVLLEEPELIFADRRNVAAIVKDTHPIRGVLENRPYDYSLTQRGLADQVNVGVICPGPEAQAFSRFIDSFYHRKEPLKTERDYLIPYPGFPTSFGLPLNVPEPGNLGWTVCPEPDPSLGSREGALELRRFLTNALDSLHASSIPNVVLICFPTRWAAWRGFKTEDERFDLHDFVKAYCVQRGIATQFLDQDTLIHSQQCRVLWWLSLALYVKSKRTPWLLDSIESDTAFVGLGYSIDMAAEQGQHVILGCSHIYSANGEGLQFRLSKIENPIIRRGNPFMSRDDARRVGDGIRQLFYEAMMRLPRRVVIHKRTAFTRDEREGLIQGLSGVDEVDMVEITIDEHLRYVSSVPNKDGGFDEDNFPVRRGTAVVLDEYTALLWCHGVAAALNPRFKYYQGKRRIPAPLTLQRHVGRTPLSILGKEILGLSKMNWNTFDLYTQLPTTIESSNQIARIGSLLDRIGQKSYDYRLFM